MGKLSDLWYGKPEHLEEFHDSSVLADIIVATNLQNGGSNSYRWKVAAVYRGVQILSDLAAELPWFTFDGGANSGSNQVSLPEIRDTMPGVLVKPDPFLTRNEFIRQTVLSLAWDGNAYLRKSAFVEGRPTIVQVLPASEVSVAWNANRTRVEYAWRNQALSTEEIDHLALNRLPGQAKGIAPLSWELIQGQIAADTFARDLFLRDGIPSGKLMHPGKLTGDEATALLEAWQTGQEDGRKTAILSGGMDYETISITPDQAQMLQSRAFGVAEIARALGIPSHLLNAATGVAGASGASMTYQNISQVFGELVRTTLAPVYLARIEEVASTWIPRGQSVRFDTSEFDRAETATRYAAHETALRSKFLTVDEVRAAEGLAPSRELAEEKEAGRELAEAISQGGNTDGDDSSSGDTAEE